MDDIGEKDRSRTGVIIGLWPEGLPEADFYLTTARQTEALGFDSLFVGDHIFFNVENPETLTLLAAMAAVTSTIQLGTAVLLLALRQPLVAAKQIATIDYLARGRLILGVGVGGEIAEEWDALDVPLARRGARTDEYLAVLKHLWSEELAAFEGEFVAFPAVAASPRPLRRGGPPIWIGGRSDIALRRAARHDGWCAYASSPSSVASSVEQLRAADVGDGFRVAAVVFTCVQDTEEFARRKAAELLSAMYRQPFEKFLDKFCAVGTEEQVAERLEEFRAAGVTDLLLVPQVRPDEFPDQLQRLAALGTRAR